MNFVTKRYAVTAERFLPDQKPWPRGVRRRDDVDMPDLYPEYVVQRRGFVPWSIRPGQWVVRWNTGRAEAWDDEDFRASFEPADDESRWSGEPDEPPCDRWGEIV